MTSTTGRFVVLSPKLRDNSNDNNHNNPGIYNEMPFRLDSGQMSPFPLMLECPDNAFAQFVHLAVQPWFNEKKNWSTGSPQTVATCFVDSAPFKRVAEEAFERRQALIWAVKLGRRTGIFSNNLSALNSADGRGTRRGRTLQLAYAFYSFQDAALCQMLSDTPTAAVHTYNPPNNPEEAAALRASFEHNENDPPACPCPARSSSPLSASDPDSSQESSVQFSPPRRINTTPSRHRHAHGHSSSVNIHFAPNVAVHIDSALDFAGSSGQVSPTKQSPLRGISLGRRLLKADGVEVAKCAINTLLLY